MVGYSTENGCLEKLTNIPKSITHYNFFLKKLLKYPHLWVGVGIAVAFSTIWCKQITDDKSDMAAI